jgi:hypothetical protein
MLEKLKGMKPTIFQDESTRFMLFTGIKITFMSLFSGLFLAFGMWIIISVNGILFEVSSFKAYGDLQEAYFGVITSELYDYIPELFSFFFFLFFSGVYLGKLLLRPFSIISEYCEKSLEDANYPYTPDPFSDFRLLTRFSDLFFIYLHQCRNEKKLKTHAVPTQFAKLRTPPFDKVYFFHFSLYIILISTISIFLLSNIAFSIYDGIFNLAQDYKTGKDLVFSTIIVNESYLIDSVIWGTIITTVISYLILSVHLYFKVSGAAFGYIATMRAFMKGKYHSRVHLIGYNHVRNYSRSFNRYLDYMTKNFGDQSLQKAYNKVTPISLANDE